MTDRKIISAFATGNPPDTVIMVLCDDGTIWKKRELWPNWEMVLPLPASTPSPDDGRRSDDTSRDG